MPSSLNADSLIFHQLDCDCSKELFSQLVSFVSGVSDHKFGCSLTLFLLVYVFVNLHSETITLQHAQVFLCAV